MPGLSDYSAENVLNYITGRASLPSLPSVYVGLFTAAPSDAGSGGTEVSGAPAMRACRSPAR